MCMGGDGWGGVEVGERYWVRVGGVSEVFGGLEVGEISFVVLPFALSSSRALPSLDEYSETQQERDSGLKQQRQESSELPPCSEQLWSSSPLSLYGLRTYPSGHSYLPSSIRNEGLTVILKALTPCEELDFSKDILPESNASWSFVDLSSSLPPPLPQPLSADEYTSGTRLYLPPSLLTTTFPPSTPIHLSVSLSIPFLSYPLTADLSFEFLPGPILFSLSPFPSPTHLSTTPLVLNFEESVVEDEQRGLMKEGEGEWEWEWGWGCEEVGEEGGECGYQDGEMIVLPDEGGRWESKEGKEFQKGTGMLFVVYAKARWVVEGEGEGEWVSKGRWEGVFSFVGDGEEEFVAEFVEWECLNGNGQYGYSVCFFFLSHFYDYYFFC